MVPTQFDLDTYKTSVLCKNLSQSNTLLESILLPFFWGTSAEAANSLTEAQKTVLASLHQDLMRVCLDHACTDVALRRSEVWRRVRWLARSALLAFNWPLALPPQAELVLA